GKVLDADGDPIKGIKITMKDDATAPNPYNIVESQSLENGDYTISGRVMPTDKLYLSVEDIDGIGNGGDFESRMIELDFSKVEYTGDKEAWHVGTKSLEQDIVLVEKSNSTNE
ncbi:MAG: radical SAM-associated putative lipoprotein, partial [Rikenellaceae bacterium]|nr:radical SAM-associated putative lipoprotein [Rikenellaceae bacterium]